MSSVDFSVSLHVGVHRTGTTHLQHLLGQNRGKFFHAGTEMWLPGKLRDPGCSINDRFGFARGAPGAPLPALGAGASVLTEMAESGLKRLLISEENYLGQYRNRKDRLLMPLYPRSDHHLEALVRALHPYPVDLFLGLREPCAFLRGLYSQVLLSGGDIPPALFFLDHGPEVIDWAAMVSRWRAVPGLRNVTVWRYEDYASHYKPIVRAMSGLRRYVRLNKFHERLHASLSALAVRKIMAEGVRLPTEEERSEFAIHARAEYPVSGGHGAFDPFPPEQRVEAVAQYDAQMAEIKAMPGVTVLGAEG